MRILAHRATDIRRGSWLGRSKCEGSFRRVGAGESKARGSRRNGVTTSKVALILSLLLAPAIASAQSAGPPPPDAEDIEMARPPDAGPGVQPPAPPAVPPSRASDRDQVGILQQRSGDGVGILQGSNDDAYGAQSAPVSPPPNQTGQWVYTSQYGWVWMPYGQRYVDEGTYGAASPYQYVYCVGVGWSWVAAPWLWGWGAYPYFGVWGPSHFAWYRGLYRSGYGWGRYRGGSPRGYSSGGYARGGANHAIRPVGRQYRPTPSRSFPSGRRLAGSGGRGGGSRRR
jgi:hypothetical protein